MSKGIPLHLYPVTAHSICHGSCRSRCYHHYPAEAQCCTAVAADRHSNNPAAVVASALNPHCKMHPNRFSSPTILPASVPEHCQRLLWPDDLRCHSGYPLCCRQTLLLRHHCRLHPRVHHETPPFQWCCCCSCSQQRVTRQCWSAFSLLRNHILLQVGP